MKYDKSILLVFPVVFAGVLGVITVVTGRGQSPKPNSPINNESLVKPTSDLRPTAVVTAKDSAPAAAVLVFAASQNGRLSSELNWMFGGKAQRGWYLYNLLISRLIGTDRGPTSPDFAMAISTWQTKAGLLATGIIDEDTLYAMVKEWQDARIQDRSFPPPDQLLTAPASDFYDPDRKEELRQVQREAYAAYKRMVAAALDDKSLGLAKGPDGGLAPEEKFLKIISSFRSREYQEKLRRETPGAGRAGLAVNSPHFTGRALDLYVGGDPVETKDSNRAIQVHTPVYLWLVRNAEKFGFQPYYYEPWHWEYVGLNQATTK